MTTAPAPARALPCPAPPPEGQVRWRELAVQLALDDHALKASTAARILGWEAEAEDGQFGDDYLLLDEAGRKVRCRNTTRNRPLYRANVESLKQEMLRRRWRFNGEPIIIGRQEQVLNGQHRLVALVLAEQARTGGHHLHWEKIWPGEVAIDTLLVVGVDESDAVVNTLDTAKPRSLKDVIYRCDYFRDRRESERRSLAGMAEHAIKLLWFRTRAMELDRFAPRQTHAESLCFLSRHGRLLEALRHIYEADGHRALSRWLSPGHASALLYLMATSGTNPERYWRMESPREEVLDWRYWDRACEFWVLLKARSIYLAELRLALTGVLNTTGGGARASSRKIAIIAKAWRRFAAGQAIQMGDLDLEYRRDADGICHLVNQPTFGGIDRGDPHEEEASLPVLSEAERHEREEARRQAQAALEKRRQERAGPGPEVSATVGMPGVPGGKPPAPRLRTMEGGGSDA